MIEPQMKHLNGNPLCAIWIETTGNDPREHEIVQICALLVDNFINRSKKVMPFYCDLIPLKPETIDFKEMTVTKEQLNTAALHGLEPSLAADRFEEWMKLLDYGDYKRIVPLTHDWPAKRPFIMNWLGFHNFNHLFHHQYRDLMEVGLILNDRANMRAEPAPFAKINLTFIAQLLTVDLNMDMDVMQKTLKIIDIYRLMLKTRY